MFENTVLEYPVLTIVSIGKKSFEAMGRIIKRSGDTVKRRLCPAEESFLSMNKIATEMFQNKNKLVVIVDDTLIRKFFSRMMRGAGLFYDTKLARLVMAYRLLVCAVSDGKYTIPMRCDFLFSFEFFDSPIESKIELVKRMFLSIERLFPIHLLIFVADGMFASKEMLEWGIQTKRRLELRMHSNRMVIYRSKLIAIRNIKELRPKGRQMARTIKVIWHELPLYITAQRRINKHGEETIVYQAATYKAKPSDHVKTYKKRWPIEKLFRTSKQYLGLQDCFSTDMKTQHNHMAAVLLAYSIAQWEMKRRKYKTAEEAIRALKRRKVDFLKQRFCRLGQIFGVIYA